MVSGIVAWLTLIFAGVAALSPLARHVIDARAKNRERLKIITRRQGRNVLRLWFTYEPKVMETGYYMELVAAGPEADVFLTGDSAAAARKLHNSDMDPEIKITGERTFSVRLRRDHSDAPGLLSGSVWFAVSASNLSGSIRVAIFDTASRKRLISRAIRVSPVQ